MLKTFPAKIFLFGEYTILSGSKALGVPYWKLQGKWSFEQKDSQDCRISRESMIAFLSHNSEEHIDRERLRRDVEKGLWFDSNIPHGYGVGSSGALAAAIFYTYGKQQGDLISDKNSLARLEDYFHGSSSGLDPLVSYVQKPILIHNVKEVQALDDVIDLSGFFLLDSGKPRQAGPLIGIFQEKLKDPQFKLGCSQVLAKDVNLAIESLIKKDATGLQHHLWHISKFQWEFFPEMIPTNLRGPWSKGLETGEYVLKLCGAGGGGFVLGYSKTLDLAALQAEFSGQEVVRL